MLRDRDYLSASALLDACFEGRERTGAEHFMATAVQEHSDLEVEGGEPVGCLLTDWIGFWHMDDGDDGEERGHPALVVTVLAVRPDRRRRGIAKRMVVELLEESREPIFVAGCADLFRPLGFEVMPAWVRMQPGARPEDISVWWDGASHDLRALPQHRAFAPMACDPPDRTVLVPDLCGGWGRIRARLVRTRFDAGSPADVREIVFAYTTRLDEPSGASRFRWGVSDIDDFRASATTRLPPGRDTDRLGALLSGVESLDPVLEAHPEVLGSDDATFRLSGTGDGRFGQAAALIGLLEDRGVETLLALSVETDGPHTRIDVLARGAGRAIADLEEIAALAGVELPR